MFHLNDLTCPITRLIMYEPVSIDQGYTFEREAIEKWLLTNNTNPLTNTILKDKNLKPNHKIKSMINKYIKKNRDLLENDDIYIPSHVLDEFKSDIKEKNISKLQFVWLNWKNYNLFLRDLNGKGYSSLYYACEHSTVESTDLIFRYLLKKKVLCKLGPVPEKCMLNNLLLLFHQYLIKMNRSFLNELIKFNNEKNIFPYFFFENELCYFIERGMYKQVEYLIETNEKLVNRCDSKGNLPLLTAVKNLQYSITKYLLSKNANIYLFNRDAESAVYIALRYSFEQILCLLFPNTDNKLFKLPALHFLLETKPFLYHMVLAKLVRSHRTCLKMRCSNDKTALYLACEKHDIEAIKIFLEEDVDIQESCTSLKHTALHIACIKGSTRLIKLLVSSRKSVLNQLDAKFQSPLDLALKFKHYEAVEYLISKGAYCAHFNRFNIPSFNEERPSMFSNLGSKMSSQKVILSGQRNNKIAIWENDESKMIDAHQNFVSCLCFIKKFRFLSGSGDGLIKQWSCSSKHPEKTFNGHVGPVNCLRFNFKENNFLSGSSDTTIKLWDTETGSTLKTYYGHFNPVFSTEYVDEKRFISSDGNGKILLWDIETGSVIQSMHDHIDSVCSLRKISSVEFVSGSWDKTIKMWDLRLKRSIKTFQEHKDTVWCIEITRTNKIISGSSDSTIKIWDLNSMKNINTFSDHKESIFSLKLDTNQRLVSGSKDKNIKIWDLNTGTCIKTLKNHNSDWILSLDFA